MYPLPPEIGSESKEALGVAVPDPLALCPQLRAAGPEEMVSERARLGSQQEPVQEDPHPDTHAPSMPTRRGPRSKCLSVQSCLRRRAQSDTGLFNGYYFTYAATTPPPHFAPTPWVMF